MLAAAILFLRTSEAESIEDRFTGVVGQITDWGENAFGGIFGSGSEKECPEDSLSCPDGQTATRDPETCKFTCAACDPNEISMNGLQCRMEDLWDNFMYGDEGNLFNTDPATGLLEMLWDQLDFGAMTAPVLDSTLGSWLEGIEFENPLKDINDQLQELIDQIPSTEDVTNWSTSDILDAIGETQILDDIELWGWKPIESVDDLEKTLNSLDTIYEDFVLSDMIPSSAIQDQLDVLEDRLAGLGFDRLLNYDEIQSTLEDQMQAVDDLTTQTDIETALNDFRDFMAGTVDIEQVEQDVQKAMEDIKDQIDSQVESGNDALQNVWDQLDVVEKSLEKWEEFINGGSSELELLDSIGQELENVIFDVAWDWAGLPGREDWLDSFIASVEKLLRVDNNEWDTCDTTFVEEQVENAYTKKYGGGIISAGIFRTNCKNIIGPYKNTCDCYTDDIYTWMKDNNKLQTLECVYDSKDTLSVEQTIRQCGGEEIETTDETSLAADAMNALADLGDSLIDMMPDVDLGWDVNEAVGDFRSTATDIQEFMKKTVDTSGDSTSWINSLYEAVGGFDIVAEDLGAINALGGGNFDISKIINLGSDALKMLSNGNDDPEPEPTQPPTKPPGKSNNSSSFPIWAIIVVAGCVLLVLLMCIYTIQVRKKLADEDWEAEVSMEGGDAVDLGDVGGELPDSSPQKGVKVEYAAVPRPVAVQGTQVVKGEVD